VFVNKNGRENNPAVYDPSSQAAFQDVQSIALNALTMRPFAPGFMMILVDGKILFEKSHKVEIVALFKTNK